MIGLEQAVRPYVAPTALATRRVISRVTVPSTDLASVSWGDAGTLPDAIPEDDPAAGVNFTLELCDDTYKEVRRDVVRKKISSTSDPDTWVEVERVEKIAFNKQTKKKLVGVIASETTAFKEIDLGGAFQTVGKADKCQSEFTLHN